jgi:hypothetical protein
MKTDMATKDVTDWLMEGDPAIRWQTMRDVLGKPATQWKREQAGVAKAGWGGQLLGLRDPSGRWDGGIYGPKWTGTTYTLLLLREMGLPRATAAGAEGARIIVDKELGQAGTKDFAKRLANLDLCITGMDLALLGYFDARDGREGPIVEQLLRTQMADGGWNCAGKRHEVIHSSLHTTINVLDGLADYAQYYGKKAAETVRPAIGRAEEFILQHRLFRSDKTGAVIHEEFTQFSFPPRWHWDVLRGLDHFRRRDVRDERLGDAMDLLRAKRGLDGRWKLENHYKGREFFRLEKPGQPSRWNTLRALRVLRWWA